ncbi:hypothetical protein KGF54_003927 [Candida jiufengensis]|uniref:uncharacterized protein n=1 Tax=Candida jiufengensis TaxID=497108 RepID=UPI0022243892|nr:uncharacterized protein KGF54_003927 [Candida jiufengensis]KAI5950853.1 hypothetical protein KGF54_003927 [Candida jiufengensis]
MNHSIANPQLDTMQQQQQQQSASFDEENEFDNLLDIFSSDMDFEQAYSMYNNLQQSKIIGSFEELNKFQQLNSQYITNISSNQQQQQQSNSISSTNSQQPLQQLPVQQLPSQQQHNLSRPDEFAHSRQQILNGPSQYSQQLQQNQQNQQNQQQLPAQQEQQQPQEEEQDDEYDQFFTNTESDALERFLDNLANPNSSADPLQFYKSNSPNNYNNHHIQPHKDLDLDFNFEMHTMKVPQHLQPQHQQQQQQQPKQVHSPPYEQHKMTTTSNSHMNNNITQQPSPPHSFHRQQLPLPPQQPTLNNPFLQNSNISQDQISLKRELAEAFAPTEIIKPSPQPQPSATTTKSPKQNKKSTSPKTTTKVKLETTDNQSQLITPPISGDESKRRPIDDEMDEDEMSSSEEDNSLTLVNSNSSLDQPQLKKRRRSSNKPLLTLAQKRLNHSASEQKRRMACKSAYNRCLNLIINLKAFNELPEQEIERKSKRALKTKEGLPNLSKHSALVRISNEMILIKDLNEKLRNLLN